MKRYSMELEGYDAGHVQPMEMEHGAWMLVADHLAAIKELQEALEAISKIAEEQYPVSIGNQWAWGEVHAEARKALEETNGTHKP